MAHCWSEKQDFDVMERVGKVERLTFYPVKSMSGIDVPHLECTHSGLRYNDIGDRNWMVMSSTGRNFDGRMQPRLCTVKPSFHGDMLHLDGEGMDTLMVPREIKADGADIKSVRMTVLQDALGVDCGEEASQWLSKFLGKEGLRLVYAAPGLKRRHLVDNEFIGPLAAKDDAIVYQDLFPGFLMTEASLQDLNSRLKKPVDFNRFRGNIIATDTTGPFVEDDWTQIKVGDTVLSIMAPDPRCVFTTVDPLTGTKDPDMEPLRTLNTYRLITLPESLKKASHMPCFGVGLSVRTPGVVHVGDSIMAVKDTPRAPPASICI